MGTIKHGLIQQSTLYDGALQLVAFNEDRPGFSNIDFMSGCSLQEIARILDEDDLAVVELSRVLSSLTADKVLLPPVLGITRAEEIREKISGLSGLDIGEYVTAPSALGLRLLNALRKKAVNGDHLVALDTVKVERIVDGRVEGHMGTKGKREITVHGNNLFIATGGPLTGFHLSGDRMFEPLTGTTVSADIESDINCKFLAEHPLMSKGIGPEILVKGFDHVRALGATACGFGLHKALASGFHAGDGL
jgi:glycerol-3-phosphate dehydrogenase subunit B